jgi:hypothetical protein
MALQRRRPSYSIGSRIRVPSDLRPHIGKREIVRSLKTTDYKRARLLEQQWAGHVAALFNLLRPNHSMMNPSEIDRIVALYLEGTIDAVERRLATREWNVFIGDPRGPGGWNEWAQSQVGARVAALKEALAYNDVDAETLSFAARALPGVAEETTRVLARRLIEAQYEAGQAELKALQGEPLPRRALHLWHQRPHRAPHRCSRRWSATMLHSSRPAGSRRRRPVHSW